MTWLTAIAHLARHEFRRTCRPGPLLLMLAPMVVFSLLSLRHPWHPRFHVLGSLALIGASWFPQAIPLVAGLAGSSLAGDIRRGVVLTVLARGLSRGQYLLAKGMAAAASSSLVALAGMGIFYLAAWVKLPPGNSTFASGPGPVPALFQQSPLANDLLAAAMGMTGAAALSLLGLLAGAVVANEYVAMMTPLLVVLFGVFALDEVAPYLNPYLYLHVADSYEWRVAESLLPYAAFVYWLVFGACMGALARWIFARRELV